jgi:hypothetical protein
MLVYQRVYESIMNLTSSYHILPDRSQGQWLTMTMHSKVPVWNLHIKSIQQKSPQRLPWAMEVKEEVKEEGGDELD